MRLSLFSLVSLVFFVFFGTVFSDTMEWKASEKKSAVANPVAASAESVAAGKKVYIKECSSCHGPKGKGDGPSSGDFATKTTDITDAKFASQTDGAVFYKITVGRRPMPGFRDTLSDDERWNVVNYIRTLSTVKK
ncbi:MAG: cytochrome c [Spirochaetia bacterium]|nr:cytochrome c [Spirochaetia bacterium]